MTDAALTDTTVKACRAAGLSDAAIIGVLVEEKTRLLARIVELDRIAPFKITGPDGKVFIWRCPDELVPNTRG